MAREFYIKEDHVGDLYGLPGISGSQGVSTLFMDNPEKMRIRFEKTKERLRLQDKKLGKKAHRWFTSAQKYTTL